MQTTTIKIEGMTCMGCVNSVKNVLKIISGVSNVEVSLDQSQAIIQYDTEITSIGRLTEVIEDAGFNVIN